ncbi:MAG: hypothetical protein ACTHWO_05310 [Nesterenkonia sp.]
MSSTPPHGQPSGPSKPSSPDPKRPTAEEEKRSYYSQFLGWLVLAIIVAYAGMQMPLPWRLMTLAAALVGVVGGVVLFVHCIRRKLSAVVLIGAVLVTLSCGLLLTTAGMQTIFWEASVSFDECMRSALTQRSMDQCTSQYEEEIFSSISGVP